MGSGGQRAPRPRLAPLGTGVSTGWTRASSGAAPPGHCSSEPGRHKLKDSLGALQRTASCRMCPTRVAPCHSLQGAQRAGLWPCRSLAPCKGRGQHQAQQRLPGKQCRHGFSNFISSFSSLGKLREKAKRKKK